MEELDVFCNFLTKIAAELTSESPMQALVQADDDERIILFVLVQEEFSLTVELPSGEALERMTEVLSQVKDYTLNHYRGNFFSESSWEKFRALPGKFEFLCEDAPQVCYRLAQWRVTERFGRRFFKGIDLYEDALQIHMLGGNYLVSYDNFRADLEKQMGYMALLLRKPIRKRYGKKN